MSTNPNKTTDVAGMMERLRLGFHIDMAVSGRKAMQADSDMKGAAATIEVQAKALHLANLIIGRWEPGDSRAVSDEFVALAAVECDLVTPEVEHVLDEATARYEAMPAPEPQPVLVIGGAAAATSILVVRDDQPMRGPVRAVGEADIVITDRGRIVKAKLNVTGSHVDDHPRSNAVKFRPQEPFPQPQRKDGEEPCGECRLQPDEACDICGAQHATRTIGVDLAAGPDETVEIVVMTQDEYERLSAELKALREKVSSCQWHWPEGNTESESCAGDPAEVVESAYGWGEVTGEVVAVARGGIVEVTYCAALPPAPDADSDDDFWVEEPTEDAAAAKIAAECARRAALAQGERHDG